MHGQDEMPGVGVLIPAGGSGSRMGGVRKQFRLLGDAPLYIHTASIFATHSAVVEVVLAVPGDIIEEANAALDRRDWSTRPTVVEGGPSRQASVGNALSALRSSCEVVLVHDAVRPFVSPVLIDAVIRAVESHGAAAAALPVNDTLRKGDGAFFAETVDRSGIYRMQTPQGFRREMLERAHREAVREGTEATDEVALVQALGIPVHIVEGDERNVKLTTASDWEFVEVFWHQLRERRKTQ